MLILFLKLKGNDGKWLVHTWVQYTEYVYSIGVTLVVVDGWSEDPFVKLVVYGDLWNWKSLS